MKMLRKRMAKLLLAVFVFSLVFTNSSQPAGAVVANSGLFKPYVVHQVVYTPDAVAIGDVNGDGRNDVAMTADDNYLYVFLQNSSGVLDPPITYLTSGSYTNKPQSVDIGDLNNDGKADVVVGNTRKNIEVFVQNSSGGLDAGVAYNTNNSYSVKIGDVNNDGRMDVVGLSWGTDNDLVDIFLQNISGTLNSPVSYTAAHGGYDEVDIGDVNHDGRKDIIVMSGQGLGDNIGVLLQNSTGGFAPTVYYDLGGTQLTSGVTVGDINHDSLEDIIVSYGGNKPDSYIGVFKQNTSQTLNTAVYYPAYDCPESIELGDFNLDGKKDVAVLHGGWNDTGIYIQNDSGGLLPYELYALPYATHYNPKGLAVGDINSDGTDDLAIADYNHGLVILYGAPPIVLGTDPLNGAADVPTSKTITVNFSKYIRKGLNFNGIKINSGGTVVDYTYSINGSVLTLDPVSDLATGTPQSISIPAGAVEDLAGNGLEANYNFTFITQGPGISLTDPANGAANFPVNKAVYITFNKTVQQGVYFNDISLKDGSTVVDCTYQLNGNILTLTPSANLAVGPNYTVTIPAGAVKDLTNIDLYPAYTFSFTASEDTTAPTIASTNPINGATNVPISQTIAINFNESVQRSTYFKDISLKTGSTVVDYTYNLSNNILTLTPTGNLSYGSTYVVTIPSGAAADLAGNSLTGAASFSFTTQNYSGGGSTSDSGSSNTPVPTASTSANPGEVNIPSTALTLASSTEGGQTVTDISVNETAALAAVSQSTSGTNVVVQVPQTSDVVNAKIPAGLLTALAQKASTIEIQTNTGSYTLPAKEINAGELAKELGVDITEVKINIIIAQPKPQQVTSIQKFIDQHNLNQVAAPVEFEVTGTAGDKKIEVNNFSGYVSREIQLSATIDPDTAVGVVQNADGTLSPVPTQFKIVNGKTTAVIKRKTNSVYTVVEHKKTFTDLNNHWARTDINLLASKLIVSGLKEDTYAPENKVTRAEFAALVTRALGLQTNKAKVKFSDVKPGEWYTGYISAAVEAGIIRGYADGTYKPNCYVTRQEMAAIIIQALKLTGQDGAVTEAETGQYLSKFADRAEVSSWAKTATAAAVKNGILSGDAKGSFAPARNSTRAEAAVMIKKMMEKAKFI